MGYGPNYTVPNSSDTLGIYEYFAYVNRTAGNLFFPIILLVIWIVTFIGLKRYTTSRAFTAASFLTAGLSTPLAILNLLDPKFMYLSFFLTAAGVIWLKLELSKG